MSTFKFLCCLFTLPVIAAAQSTEAKTLRNVKAFQIVVETLDPSAKTISLTTENLQRAIELKLRLASIPMVQDSTSDNLNHDIRHAVVTVQRLMGHSDLDTTRQYLNPDEDLKRKAVSRLSLRR